MAGAVERCNLLDTLRAGVAVRVVKETTKKTAKE